MALFENNSGIASRIYDSWDRGGSLAEQILMLPTLSRTQLDALQQLVTPVWDGNLISKQARSELCRMGLVSTWNGLNFATQDGYCVLERLGYLEDNDKFVGGKYFLKGKK